MDELYNRFFKAFSNKTRVEIITLLRKKPLSVSEICAGTGYEQSRISHNLKCLEHCGFVNVTSDGNFRVYSLDEEVIIPILNMLAPHLERYGERIKTCEALT